MNQFSNILKPLMVMLLIIAFCVIMYYGKSFLMPIAYGAMFAFLMNPLYGKLLEFGLNKYLSAIVSISIIILFFVILLSALGWQIQELSEQKDQIKKELVQKQKQIQQFTKRAFGISPAKQEKYAQKMVDKVQNKVGSFLGNTLSLITNFFLILIYAILLLTERNRIRNFFIKLFNDSDKAEDTIDKTSSVAQSYLRGKLTIIAILAVVYSIGFLIAGIQYAVLIAVLAAFITFIPYIGNIIGGLLAALITMATGGSMTEILIIFGVMGAAQIVESYVLEPWIVGSKVNLNPLFSIVAVIALGAIWGAAGAVIALPLVGILKIIFDHLEKYKPVGYLMSDS